MITTSKQYSLEFRENPQTMPWMGSCSLKVGLRKFGVLLRDQITKAVSGSKRCGGLRTYFLSSLWLSGKVLIKPL